MLKSIASTKEVIQANSPVSSKGSIAAIVVSYLSNGGAAIDNLCTFMFNILVSALSRLVVNHGLSDHCQGLAPYLFGCGVLDLRLLWKTWESQKALCSP